MTRLSTTLFPSDFPYLSPQFPTCLCLRCIFISLRCIFISLQRRVYVCGVYLLVCRYMLVCTQRHVYVMDYGVASVNRIDKIIGLFCRILSRLQGSFAKETYNLIEPTNRCHPIVCTDMYVIYQYAEICVYDLLTHNSYTSV